MELVPKKGKSISEVARRLGISSQLLGQYMKGRHEPKLSFYEAWAREFGEDITSLAERNVSHETSTEENVQGEENLSGLLVQLMKMQNRLLETQNKILEETKDLVSSKIVVIEQSLNTISSRQDEIIKPVRTGIAYQKLWVETYAEDSSKGDPSKKKAIQLRMGKRVLDLTNQEVGKDTGVAPGK